MCQASIPQPHFVLLKAHVPRSIKTAYLEAMVIIEDFLIVIDRAIRDRNSQSWGHHHRAVGQTFSESD